LLPAREVKGRRRTHSFSTHVNLPAPDQLGNVGRVVRLEDGDLDSLVGEVTLGLGEEDGDVVGGGVPTGESTQMRRSARKTGRTIEVGRKKGGMATSRGTTKAVVGEWKGHRGTERTHQLRR
jgi:hypothetical protein